MAIEETLWVQKYRPKKLEDLRLPEQYSEDFRHYIKTGDIPHLLLYGPPGSGKTTIAKVLCSKNGIVSNPKDNVLKLNGSAREHRGISCVENVVEPFLKYPPQGNDKYKIVFYDEGDNITQDGFRALRNIVETYSKYGRFIITCNYISKIPDAIQSRLGSGMYAFEKIPVSFVKSYCKDILDKEQIEYKDEDIQYAIDNLYPDIRKLIGVLQRNSRSGKLQLDKENVLTNESKIILEVKELIDSINSNNSQQINKCLQNLVQSVNDPGLQFGAIYENLFFENGLPVPAKIIISDYSNKHNFCLSPSMNFMAMIFEIIRSLREYGK